MTEQVERVAKAIRDQNRFHMQREHPSMTFNRGTLTADELRLARAAIAAMQSTPQEEMRCAECDCDGGECTWIAPAKPTVTPQEAAKVLIDALEASWPHNWQNVWDAMKDAAREMDMPAAFMEALPAISEDSQ